jgi:hypothetical protein
MKVKPYYSAKEAAKDDRVYHTHNDCPSGRQILVQLKGQPKGYKLCDHCAGKG